MPQFNLASPAPLPPPVSMPPPPGAPPLGQSRGVGEVAWPPADSWEREQSVHHQQQQQQRHHHHHLALSGKQGHPHAGAVGSMGMMGHVGNMGGISPGGTMTVRPGGTVDAATGHNGTPHNRSSKGRKMSLASFPNQGHLLVDENSEYAHNDDRLTYLLSTASDGESLSDRQCYVRSHFVELFIATPKDVSARHSRGAQKLHVNQIGLRCAYCVKIKPRDRAERAICYPSSISRIYQTVADMQRFHFESCVAIPPRVLHVYKSLKTTRPRGVGSPQSYWDKSAREIGLVDTGEGIQVNVKEGGKERFEKQRKSAITGLLESFGRDNQQGRQGSVTFQGQLVKSQVQVGGEGVFMEASLQGPQNPPVTRTVLTAVVSSPGSDNVSNDEISNNHGQNSAAVICVPGAQSGPCTADKADRNDEKSKQDLVTTTSVEAEEDANMLLMLKKTPESPLENSTVAETATAVIKEEDKVSVPTNKTAV